MSLETITSVTEGSMFNVSVELTTSGSLACDLEVTLMVTPGSATSKKAQQLEVSDNLNFHIGSMQLHAHSISTITDVDYDPDDPFTVTFSMGSGDGTVETAMITAIDDPNVEGEHDFTVSIESTSPPAMLGTSSRTATIMDDDRKFDLWWEYITLFTGIPVVSIYSC